MLRVGHCVEYRQDTQKISGLLSGRPVIMDSRSFELTMKHRPGCGTIEPRRLDFVYVGPRVATTLAPRSGLHRRHLFFMVSPCGLEVVSWPPSRAAWLRRLIWSTRYSC
jgi:hypothetical protein